MTSRKENAETPSGTSHPAPNSPIEIEQPFGRLNWSYSGNYLLCESLKSDRVDRSLASGSFSPAKASGGDSTLFWNQPTAAGGSPPPGERLGIKLHIDIDGSNPLNVVSGSVAELRLYPVIRRPVHFVGQVVKNKTDPDGRTLMVEGLAFTWPGTRETITRLMIKLTPTLPSESTLMAEVTFITAGCRTEGPFILNRSAVGSRDEEATVGV